MNTHVYFSAFGCANLITHHLAVTNAFLTAQYNVIKPQITNVISFRFKGGMAGVFC